MVKIKINSIFSLGILLLVFLSASNAFSQIVSTGVNNPIEYYNKRTEALSLAKSEKWQELIPIAEDLTQQYQMDGDLFYILGLSYYETEQYQQAIAVFKKLWNWVGLS